MPKWFIRALMVAFVLAGVATLAGDGRTFEEKAERVAIAEQASALGTKCPLSRQYIDEADLGLLRLCIAYGLSAFEAAKRYPESAAKVFAVYGKEKAFQKILDQYGHQVIPIISYFVENGSFKFQARQMLGEVLDQVWAGQLPKWELTKLTREQIGLVAIYEIAARGHEILAEFEIVDGVAKPKPFTGSILEAKQFFLGGIGDLETILVRGERLPTWKEVGSAGLDVAVLAGGVGGIAKVARVGGDALVEKSAARLMAEGAYETLSVAGKTVKNVAPYAALYVVVTRPSLIPYFGGWVAEQFGINRYVGMFIVYFVGVLLALECLRRLTWYVQVIGRLLWPLRCQFAGRQQRVLSAQSWVGAS